MHCPCCSSTSFQCTYDMKNTQLQNWNQKQSKGTCSRKKWPTFFHFSLHSERKNPMKHCGHKSTKKRKKERQEKKGEEEKSLLQIFFHKKEKPFRRFDISAPPIPAKLGHTKSWVEILEYWAFQRIIGLFSGK